MSSHHPSDCPVRLTRDQQVALLSRARAGDAAARCRLVSAAMGYINRVADRYGAVPPPEREELVQIGTLKLHERVVRWDPARAAFSTFAICVVRGAMARQYARCKGVVAAPDVALAELNDRAESEAETDEEHRRRDEARVALQVRFGADSLDEPIDHQDGDPCLDFLPSPSQSPEDEFAERERDEQLQEAVQQLPPVQREIIARRLLGHSLESIAPAFNLSWQRVQQIEREAIGSLRGAMAGL